ncbi:MAG: hypothetical protein JXO51_11915 [Candidatus Aminicenantes bacterium]|nr:hypothetical protein [Candidatus Aminicenantes bacterium]
MRQRKAALIIGGMALCVLMVGAAPKSEPAFGAYLGSSFSIGKEFIDMTSGGHTANHYQPGFVLGLYGQHDFSDDFGLQLSVAYQRFSNEWSFHYFDRHDEGKESLGGVSVSLNGAFMVARSAMNEFYFLAGLGFLSSSFANLGALFQVCGGIGGKFRLMPGSSTKVNLGAVLHHVMYSYGKARNAEYVRLQAGLEFRLRDRGQR